MPASLLVGETLDAPRFVSVGEAASPQSNQKPFDEPDCILPALDRYDGDANDSQVTRRVSETTNGQSRPAHKISPLIRLRGARPCRYRQFCLLQSWEGTVTSKQGDTFLARLVDLHVRTNPIEIAEIPIDEIPVPDRCLLALGTVFYWSIGYETKPGGQLTRASEIRVRRSPVWSHRDIDEMKARAKELEAWLGYDVHGDNEESPAPAQ